jgi:hypothetical protein
MSAAHKRIAELLDRWQASVELHSSYLELDDAAYAKLKDWPRHQRPTRLIVDLARSRLQDLKRQLADRHAKGDDGYAESLELMSFLTTLLGSEHIDRYIPQASAAAPRRASSATATASAAVAKPAAGNPATTTGPRPSVQPNGPKPRPARAPPAAANAAKVEKPPKPDKAAATVIADAARLLSWGREWPQLAGLIARLADRPPEQAVWAILRTHRAAIEARARRVPD